MSFGFGFSFPQLFGSSGAATPVSTDASFPYVSLLAPGNGTNGTQNNTFLDSSTNNFTITRNGTPTQGTFTPFSQTGWGGFFNGTTDYLNTPANAAFAFGTGDFTVECWMFVTYPFGTTGQGRAALISNRSAASSNTSLVLQHYNSKILFGTTNTDLITGTITLTTNTWIQIAVSRASGTLRLFVNGVLDTTVTSNTTNFSDTNAFAIGTDGLYTGYYFTGYISNARLVKGTAVYTAAFTPPTTPLTAITNTSLLTLQNNYFKDNSANAFAITVVGTPSIQAFSPFEPTAAYAAATNGGTGYFNGTTDYLSAPDNAALEFGTNSITLECWFYMTGTSGYLFDKNNSGISAAPGFSLFVSTTAITWYYDAVSNGYVISPITTTVAKNQWNHIALVRSVSGPTTNAVFLNGARVGTSATATAFPNNTQNFRIGAAFLNSSIYSPITGFVSNARIVNGTAVYDPSLTTLTVPTAPLTAITNTSLLLSGTNAGIIDNSAKNTAVTTVGNAQISTAQSQWGGGSMLFDGTGDWVTVLDTPVLRFGTGDFTVEGWVYKTTTGTAVSLVSKGAAATGWTLGVSATNFLTAGYTATTLTGTVTTLSANTWYYFALVRSGVATGNIKLYINGTLEASSAGAITTDFNQTDVLYIGASRTATTPLTGYIDDLRITKAARTVTTTPTAAFPLY